MDGQRNEAADREQGQRHEGGLVDAEHVSEQQRRGLRRPGGVEMQEQQP